jgi:GDP-L-fucose synthase
MPIDLKGKKVLITGAAGMLGRPLLDLVYNLGARVVAWDIFEPDGLPSDVKYQNVDLNFEQDLAVSTLRSCDYVFHLAGAKGGTGIGRSKAADFLLNNTKSFVNLASAIASNKGNIKRLLFTSSIGAYPGCKQVYREDDLLRGQPHQADFYGGSAKRFGELICQSLLEQHGLDYVVVRPTACFGPYDRFDAQTGMVVGALIKRLADGESPIEVWGDGTAMRDLLYSRDAARGFLLAMTNGRSGEAYNLGTGKPITIDHVATTLARHFGSRVVFDVDKPSGQFMRAMDMSKSFKELGFVAEYAFERAAAETVEWYTKHSDNVKFDPFK